MENASDGVIFSAAAGIRAFSFSKIWLYHRKFPVKFVKFHFYRKLYGDYFWFPGKLSIITCFFSNISIQSQLVNCRRSPPEVFSGEGVLKVCSKFTGEHSFRSLISLKLLCTTWATCKQSTVFAIKIFKNNQKKSQKDNLTGCQQAENVLCKSCSEIFNKIHRKAPVRESTNLFSKWICETPAWAFSCELFKTLQNSFCRTPVKDYHWSW